jgi:hypothetical protein
MRLQTDPKVVAKLAEEREDANWRFRTFLVFERLKDELWHKPDDLWDEELDWDDVAEQEDPCDSE